MLKPVNRAAFNVEGVVYNRVYADTCTFCDEPRDVCDICDEEICIPFLKDWI